MLMALILQARSHGRFWFMIALYGQTFCALAAFHALRLVDVRSLVLVERDGAAAADVLTAVREAAAAGFRDDVAADRALVAGDLDDFDDVRIVLVSAHRELDAFLHDRALLVDAAAHRRFILDDQLRNLIVCGKEVILKRVARNLTQHLYFRYCILVSNFLMLTQTFLASKGF